MTVTRHRIGGIEVVADVERTPVRLDGTTVGDAWTFAYAPADADPSRPVLFLFNGGPGCASAWLHLSGLGPWQAAVPVDPADDAAVGTPLAVSSDSILDVADLVFIDPVETGLGRLADGVGAETVSGADRDARITAQLVRGWASRHGRLSAPLFLLGESYGTIRAALTATALRDEGVVVSGLAMLGQCLNAQETTQRPGNPAGYIAAMPFLAATAWYHGRGVHLACELDVVVAAAHRFAIGPYARALVRGEADDDIVAELAGFTGLTPDQLRTRRLRLDKEEFRSLLLADRGQVLGLTDARYTLPAAGPAHQEPPLDAAAVRIDPVFTAALSELLTLLEVPGAEDYRFAVDAHERWDYLEASAIGLFGGSALPSPFAVFDYPAHLLALLRARRSARLFFGTGHYDALTTVGSLEHLLTQYGIPADRVSQGRYPAGHMMYTDPASRTALAADLRSFLRGE